MDGPTMTRGTLRVGKLVEVSATALPCPWLAPSTAEEAAAASEGLFSSCSLLPDTVKHSLHGFFLEFEGSSSGWLLPRGWVLLLPSRYKQVCCASRLMSC